ncbi:hypothetical protein LZ30DRAFT_232706 [Colletotrichum cereale]|nr:hypothetical protein LZ30DRAFT_232706 [Colletotrichum cereale]
MTVAPGVRIVESRGVACQAHPVDGRRVVCIYPSSQSRGSSLCVMEPGFGRSITPGGQQHAGKLNPPSSPHGLSVLPSPWALLGLPYLDVVNSGGGRALERVTPHSAGRWLVCVTGDEGGGRRAIPGGTDSPVSFWSFQGMYLASRCHWEDGNVTAAFGRSGGPIARSSPCAEVIVRDSGVTQD